MNILACSDWQAVSHSDQLKKSGGQKDRKEGVNLSLSEPTIIKSFTHLIFIIVSSDYILEETIGHSASLFGLTVFYSWYAINQFLNPDKVSSCI